MDNIIGIAIWVVQRDPSVPGLTLPIMITAHAAGEAIDVPDIVVVPPPGRVERIPTPGAA